MKQKSLIQKTLLQFLICTALIFVLTTPLFYLLTKYFYAEDLIDVIEAVAKNQAIPPLDLERDMIAGVMIQFTMIFLLLSIAFFITMRFLTRRLWRPFDDTLHKAEQFNLAQSEIPDFLPSDILEFTRLNDSLGLLMRKNKEAYRIQKEFTENASHELQTPLAVTRSKLDLLMQEEMSKKQLKIVEELYQLNTRMGHLNRNLLLLAKIENAQYNRQETISLPGFIENLLPSYNLLRGSCIVGLKTSVKKDIAVNANPVLLECLINNLVINAIRHTATGTIEVSAGNGSILEISNPSEGVPLDSDDIFNRFHSGDSRNGTGLGLAIVKAICDYHGWSVRYRFADSRHHFIIMDAAPVQAASNP